MRVVGIVIIALWLPLASLMVVLSPPVTHILADNTVDTAHSQLSHDYLVQIANQTRAYSTGADVELPVGSDGRTAFTVEVMAHLNDVRTVFVACQWVALLLSLLLAGYLFLMRRRRAQLVLVLRVGALVPLFLVLLLAVVGFVSFDALFTAMHRLLFAEGSWLFAYDSLLICALPEPFWIGCALVWALALIVLCLLALAASFLVAPSRYCQAG